MIMELTMVKTSLLTILFFLIHFQQAFSQFHLHHEYCYKTVGNYTNKDKYKTNLELLLPNLTGQASTALFNNYSVGRGIDKANGLYLCRGDLSNKQCHDCVDEASVAITKKCPIQIESIIWYEECMVRYSNRSIFDVEDETTWSAAYSRANASDPKKFTRVLGEAIDDTIMQAAYNLTNKGYATAEANLSLLETIYIMGICTPDIVGSLCERCLRVALTWMAGCCGNSRVSFAMYLPSCWLRYDSAPFLMSEDGVQPPPSESPKEQSSSWPFSQPPPPAKEVVAPSTATILSSPWVCMALLLLIALGIPNNIMAFL